LFNFVPDAAGLGGIEIERRGAVDGFSGGTSGEDRQGPEPLWGEHQDGVDVVARRKDAKAVDRACAEFAGGGVGAVRDLVADGADFEAVRERAERRPMPGLPGFSQANDPNPELHRGRRLEAGGWRETILPATGRQPAA
jgi:hypothetical protein